MKTLSTRRRRGAAVRRAIRVAAIAAAAAVASQSALAAPPDGPVEPKLPTRLAKSQPQKAVGEVIDKNRSDWVRRQAVLPGGKVLDNYEYDFQPTTAQERFRNLRGLEKISDYEVQRALAQTSGELFATLPIARARIEDQTYRNLANLLRPDGVFAGAGVAPVIAAPVPVPCPPANGGIVFDNPGFGPGYAAGGVYGPGFGPGAAAGGLNVAPPAPAVNYGPNYGGSVYGDQSYGPIPDPTFNGGYEVAPYGGMIGGGLIGGGTVNGTVVTPGGPPVHAAPAGTPVPQGSYLTPDGRLVDGNGDPVDLNDGGMNGDSDGGGLGGGTNRGGVQPAPAPRPLGPTGRPLDRSLPNPSFNGPGLNAPNRNGGVNGGGEAIPPGSTFGPDGSVIGPTGAVLRPGSPSGIRTASHSAPAHAGYGHGGPLYGGPVYGGPGYGAPDGAPCASGQCGPAPIVPVTPVYAPPVAVGLGPAVAPVGGLWGGWVSGYYLDGDLDGTDHRAGFDYNGGGVNVGLTRQVSETLLFGAFFGYAGLEGEANRFDLGEYDVDTFQFGAYTRKLLGNFYLIGAATFGIDDYSTHRNLDYNFIQRPATANFQGNTRQRVRGAGVHPRDHLLALHSAVRQPPIHLRGAGGLPRGGQVRQGPRQPLLRPLAPRRLLPRDVRQGRGRLRLEPDGRADPGRFPAVPRGRAVLPPAEELRRHVPSAAGGPGVLHPPAVRPEQLQGPPERPARLPVRGRRAARRERRVRAGHRRDVRALQGDQPVRQRRRVLRRPRPGRRPDRRRPVRLVRRGPDPPGATPPGGRPAGVSGGVPASAGRRR